MNAQVKEKLQKLFNRAFFIRKVPQLCKLQMNCYLVEHCPENKTTLVCEELIIKYEECPNYSYFTPSKL